MQGKPEAEKSRAIVRLVDIISGWRKWRRGGVAPFLFPGASFLPAPGYEGVGDREIA
jgi:hypothetical protein